MQVPKHNRGIGAGEDRAYTARSPAKGKDERVTFRLVTMEKNGKLFIFATNTHLRSERIRKLFRRRWGIETSYRMVNKFLARTTSKLYGIRLLYFYLAILLYNLWVLLNYGKGEKVIAEALIHNRIVIAFTLAVYLQGLPIAKTSPIACQILPTIL